ncbi:hypothetical protein TWF718_009279 [Orbilia javanica]|uniref:Uncharacterized protein n=1 Tax=Orbilia javanica TaxID=47235 RepID=A0AAN8RBN6_9PEZI
MKTSGDRNGASSPGRPSSSGRVRKRGSGVEKPTRTPRRAMRRSSETPRRINERQLDDIEGQLGDRIQPVVNLYTSPGQVDSPLNNHGELENAEAGGIILDDQVYNSLGDQGDNRNEPRNIAVDSGPGGIGSVGRGPGNRVNTAVRTNNVMNIENNGTFVRGSARGSISDVSIWEGSSGQGCHHPSGMMELFLENIPAILGSSPRLPPQELLGYRNGTGIDPYGHPIDPRDRDTPEEPPVISWAQQIQDLTLQSAGSHIIEEEGGGENFECRSMDVTMSSGTALGDVGFVSGNFPPSNTEDFPEIPLGDDMSEESDTDILQAYHSMPGREFDQ